MSDRYADLRAALAAGPTPDPWTGHRMGIEKDRIGEYVQASVNVSPIDDFFFVCAKRPDGSDADLCLTGNGPTSAVNTQYIVAAAPGTIAALLAERDELANRSPSYDALLIIAQSVAAALDRAGVTDCDDPGEAIDVLLDRLRAENDYLRAYTGNSEKACVYCGLGAENQGECATGFPGCPRADDQMLCREAGVAMDRDKLRVGVAELKALVGEMRTYVARAERTYRDCKFIDAAEIAAERIARADAAIGGEG